MQDVCNMSYGIITNDINVADSNFRRGTVHFFNAITQSGWWTDVIFEGCYPSLPVLADDEYAIVTAMPFQYYDSQIMAENSFMVAVDVFKDNITKQVTLSMRGANGPNTTDDKAAGHKIILPALMSGIFYAGEYAMFLKGSGVIENGIEKPTVYRNRDVFSRGYMFVRGYIICMVYKRTV